MAHPAQISFAMVSQLAPSLALGPMMDVTGTDYAFVLADNVVRIFSLGSSMQAPAPAQPLRSAEMR